MLQPETDAGHLPRDLGDGLLLRRATASDLEALIAFQAAVFEEPVDGELANSTRDLTSGTHPRMAEGGFTLVEDRRAGRIVSSLCLIPQTWTYGGVPFEVGRPEGVATDPDYRNRGLVRTQFEVIHAWGQARGEKMQAITGIPYYYRQFGYEPALATGGSRSASIFDLPEYADADGVDEPFRVRLATDADLPFVAQRYAQATARSRLGCVRDDALWRYEVHGKHPVSDYWQEIRIVETATGDPVGLLAHTVFRHRHNLHVTLYEVRPGVSWLAVTPTVLRALRASADAYARRGEPPITTVSFDWAEHPVYDVAASRFPRRDSPFFFQIRIADLPDFLRHVAPVLERHLAVSPVVGHAGELKLSFFRTGLRLTFAAGRLATVEPWQPTTEDRGDAGFPDLTFLQLLLGARSLAELEAAFPDCRVRTDAARALLNALFPKQQSSVWPVG